MSTGNAQHAARARTARRGPGGGRRGARRVVDATVGHGGHAGALRAQGAEVLGHRPRSRRARRPRGRRLGDARDDLARGAVCLAGRARGRDGVPPRFYPSRPRRLVAPARLGCPRVQLPPGRRAGHADGTRRGATAADLLNELPEAELVAILRDYGDERRARRDGARDRAAAGAQPLRVERRPGERHPRGARRRGRARASSPGSSRGSGSR